MEEVRKYIEAFLLQKEVVLSPRNSNLLDRFIQDEANIEAVRVIIYNQKRMLEKWNLCNKIEEIIQQGLFLPNATVNKPYQGKLNFIELGWDDLACWEIEGLEEVGLEFNKETEMISGIPTKSGDFKIKLLFRVEGEEPSTPFHEKTIAIIINPDPKSLWKDKESDKDDLYWKEDNVAVSSHFLDKRIVIASKRGRSHANVGGFRDDHFEFKNFLDSGWSVLAVSDGAGSANVSRKGSQLACESVVSYFEETFTKEFLKYFDQLLLEHHQKKSEETSKKISRFVYDNLSKAVWCSHKTISEFALKTETPLNSFHATLIFTLVKKYDFGYAILTFGVGDCPIGILDKDLSGVKLMNWLDVGEFGGGTRFITMPEIFKSNRFSTRFGFKLVDDFSYMMLMTDGIYDPKFVVEANLEKIECWKDFLEDLKGHNEDGLHVDFKIDNHEIQNQLSNWMDFWSTGNHDDRTLAIIY